MVVCSGVWGSENLRQVRLWLDRYSHIDFFMDRLGDHGAQQPVIDTGTSNGASWSSLNQAETYRGVGRLSDSIHRINSSQSSYSERIISRNSSYAERVIYGHSILLDSGLWISVELIVTLIQIVASVFTLSLVSLPGHRSAEVFLFAWVVGYACGCLATLPILYWRRCRGIDRYSVQRSSETDSAGAEANSPLVARNNQVRGISSLPIEFFKIALDCFFVVWFIVGGTWIFRAHYSNSVAPKLYRLCGSLLFFISIRFALPSLLFATMFCCGHRILLLMGIHDDLLKPKGASIAFIDALPTFKFKLRKNGSVDSEKICLRVTKACTLTNGNQEEHIISKEDALCCICLAAYADDDDLKELPCSHIFHTECVDKWLKINALCPLCKLDVS